MKSDLDYRERVNELKQANKQLDSLRKQSRKEQGVDKAHSLLRINGLEELVKQLEKELRQLKK